MTKAVDSRHGRGAIQFAVTLGFAILLIASGTMVRQVRAADPAAAAPTQVLAEKGLTRLKGDSSSAPWVLAAEARVHEQLEPFRKAEAAHRAAAKQVRAEDDGAKADKQELDQAEKNYETYTGWTKNPQTIPREIAARFASRQLMLQSLQDELNKQVEIVNRLRPKLANQANGGVSPALKSAIVDWMAARAYLLQIYWAAQPELAALEGNYQTLADDPDVAAALKSLGKKHRLGSKDYEQDKKRMAEVETSVLVGEVPYYREGMFDFVGAVLNEKVSLVLKIESVNVQSANWIPAATLEQAGIAIDPQTPTVNLNITGGPAVRQIQCRKVKVPSLRLGKYLLEDLEFLALPADAKDLGAQLVIKELADYDVSQDRDKWLFKLARKGGDAEKPKDN
jgi:hypothetical protein